MIQFASRQTPRSETKFSAMSLPTTANVPSFHEYRTELARVLASFPPGEIEKAVSLILETWHQGAQILTCGNGGSASTASHYVTDWGKMSYFCTRRPLHGHCLNDNIGMLTAYGNDNGYDQVFSLAVENYGRAGDLLVVVSGSGNSPNVVKAVETAKARGMRTLAICGFDGGKVKQLADQSVWVRSHDMQICEDCHLVFGHFVMKALTGELLNLSSD